MSTVSSLSGTGSAAAALTGSTATDRTTMSRDDFYKIMIGELSNQDPFQPMDNQQYLNQLSSLQNLDSMGKLTSGIEKLVLQQQIGAASGLIGRQVLVPSSGTDGATPSVQGTVAKVQVLGGNVTLMLDGNRMVRLEDVTQIG
jgi:flagellar hook assembly protein FlgD